MLLFSKSNSTIFNNRKQKLFTLGIVIGCALLHLLVRQVLALTGEWATIISVSWNPFCNLQLTPAWCIEHYNVDCSSKILLFDMTARKEPVLLARPCAIRTIVGSLVGFGKGFQRICALPARVRYWAQILALPLQSCT